MTYYANIFYYFFFFFFNDTATTEIYTLSLHDALPIYSFVASLRLPQDAWIRLGQSQGPTQYSARRRPTVAAGAGDLWKMDGLRPVYEAAARHLGRLRDAQQREGGRYQVRQLAALPGIYSTGADHERNRIRGVRRVRAPVRL